MPVLEHEAFDELTRNGALRIEMESMTDEEMKAMRVRIHAELKPYRDMMDRLQRETMLEIARRVIP